MKKIIIFGNGDFARLLKYYIESDDLREVACFTVDRTYIKSEMFFGIPVIPFEDIELSYPPDEYEILIGIGNSRMNDVRKSTFYRIKKKGYTVATYIHSSCSIHSKNIGEGNILLESCLVYPYSEIGIGNLMWDHVLISHDCVVGNFNTFSSYADLCGYVEIGDNGYFGKHCILNDKVKIADYTLVGAAGYVKRNTSQYDVVVPARGTVLDGKRSTDFF